MSETEVVKPMKVEVYNSIIEDFNKLTSYSSFAEDELKKKYSDLPVTTLGSLVALLVQRAMKRAYRKSPAISAKYYELYQNAMKERKRGEDVIVKLADSQGICPALFARSLLQHVYDSTTAKKYIKDPALIEDMDLAYQVFKGIIFDNNYGPYSDEIKQHIGLEYEKKLEMEMKQMDIYFTDESMLRAKGYDKTPDFKLDIPIAVGDFIIHWVESKALFADEENHAGYLKDQFQSYWNRFGSGLVIYWFGYLETIDSTPEVNDMFIIRTAFPPKESITMYNFESC